MMSAERRPMKPQRLTLAVLILTGINLVILVIALVFVLRPAVTPDVADVLRGRALEIVDSQGKVRAQILIQPASEQNGQQYAETVLFRLINPDGLPRAQDRFVERQFRASSGARCGTTSRVGVECSCSLRRQAVRSGSWGLTGPSR